MTPVGLPNWVRKHLHPCPTPGCDRQTAGAQRCIHCQRRGRALTRAEAIEAGRQGNAVLDATINRGIGNRARALSVISRGMTKRIQRRSARP